jgi:ABC-2 type transport system permease protein
MNTDSVQKVSLPRRYAAIYAALWRNSVVREMGFKSNFLLWIVVELLWFALQLCFIGVVYLHTDHIATWSKWQVVLLVGASHFIQQLFQALFLSNLVQFSELVRTGRLDFMLLLPMNPRFLVSLRVVDLGGFVNAGSALAVIVYAARQLRLTPSLAQIAGFLCLCLAGMLIHYSLMFLLSTVAFWTVRSQGIVWGYYSFFNVARLPDAAFKGFFKAFFTFGVPMLLVANVPAKLLLDKLQSPGPMLLMIGMGCACFVLSELFWRFSLRHYTSASA